jgi:hypothetical protein
MNKWDELTVMIDVLAYDRRLQLYCLVEAYTEKYGGINGQRTLMDKYNQVFKTNKQESFITNSLDDLSRAGLVKVTGEAGCMGKVVKSTKKHWSFYDPSTNKPATIVEYAKSEGAVPKNFEKIIPALDQSERPPADQ